MAKIKIFKKDGSPSPYFWTDRDGTEGQKTVYKQTTDGVIKRMKGVQFDTDTKRIHKA